MKTKKEIKKIINGILNQKQIGSGKIKLVRIEANLIGGYNIHLDYPALDRDRLYKMEDKIKKAVNENPNMTAIYYDK